MPALVDVDLAALAAEIAGEHDDVEEAIDAFLVAAGVPANWLDHAAGPLVRRGARDMLHDARHSERHRIMGQQPQPCTHSGPGTFNAVAEVAERAILQLQIRGMRLASMTGEEAVEQGFVLRQQGQGMVTMGRFLERIGKATPKGKLIGDVWNEVKARKLWKSLH